MIHLLKKKLAFINIVNSVKGFIRTITGAFPLTLTNCVDNESIIDYSIYGNSVQNGTPKPDSPIEVESVGEYDETSGKYKIPITVGDGTRNITTNIYLDEPLRKVGDYADYIDFENSKVVRNVYECDMTKIYTEKNTKAVIYGKYKSVIRFSHNLNTMKCPLGKKNSVVMCNILVGKDANSFSSNIECTFFHSDLTTHFYTSLSKERLGVEDTDTDTQIVNKHAEYVKANVVKAYYQLDTPTETPITLPKIPTFKGTSTLTAGTTIQPSNAEVTYYSIVKE